MASGLRLCGHFRNERYCEVWKTAAAALDRRDLRQVNSRKTKRAPEGARSNSHWSVRRWLQPGLLGDRVGPGAFRLLGDDRVGAAGEEGGDGAVGVGRHEGAVRAFRQLVDL